MIRNSTGDMHDSRPLASSSGDPLLSQGGSRSGGGSTLMMGQRACSRQTARMKRGAEAMRPTPHADERAEADDIVVTGERYRINTLNCRLGDVRDAPQSISIIPREIIEQQAATTLARRPAQRLRDQHGRRRGRRRSGRRQSDAARLRCPQRHFRRRHPRFRQLHPRHVQRRAGRGGQGPVVGADRPRFDRRLYQHVHQAARAARPSSAAPSA